MRAALHHIATRAYLRGVDELASAYAEAAACGNPRGAALHLAASAAWFGATAATCGVAALVGRAA